jgi:hypothetical protein
MSGFVDSGREIGHGNIDANDPEPTSCPREYVSFLTHLRPPWGEVRDRQSPPKDAIVAIPHR